MSKPIVVACSMDASFGGKFDTVTLAHRCRRGASTPSPLTLAVTTDPISGVRDGLVKRPETDGLIFESDTENEFYNMRASLNVADGIRRPVSLPKNVRLYFLSGFQHGGNNPPDNFPGPAGMCENPTNPNYHGPTVRALLMALDAWADKGIEPPESNYPRLRAQTLVTLETAQKVFPNIPSVTFPRC